MITRVDIFAVRMAGLKGIADRMEQTFAMAERIAHWQRPGDDTRAILASARTMGGPDE